MPLMRREASSGAPLSSIELSLEMFQRGTNVTYDVSNYDISQIASVSRAVYRRRHPRGVCSENAEPKCWPPLT